MTLISLQKVLVVDDVPENLAVVARLLASEGYDVRAVTNGQDALAAVATDLPDLVLLDIRMPGMDGFAVCARLKADPFSADVPVIFLSASDDLPDKLRAFREGGADYVEKPFQDEEVLARVRVHLALRQAQRELMAARDSLESKVVERTAMLALREAQYKRLVENAPDIIYSRSDRRGFLYANSRLNDILGYSIDDLNHRPDLWFDSVHPEDRAAYDRIFNHPDGHEGTVLEYRIRDVRGDWHWLEDRTILVQPNDSEILVDGLATEVTEQVERRHAMISLVYHDTLTGLANRKRLHEFLDELPGPAAPFSLLLFDLDRFKEINDALGHQTGDRLLIMLAERLRETVETSDTLVSRLGGDEFAIAIAGGDLARAKLCACHILMALERPFDLDGMRLEVRGSIGIACAPEDGANASEILRCADVAMYAAKRTLSGYSTYASDTDTNTPASLALLSEFSRAIESDQLLLYYQPKMVISDGRIAGFESLVRWNHPRFGLLTPDQFLPLVEVTKMIQPMTAWVIDTAVAQIAAWAREGVQTVVAVNLSARNLVEETIPDRIAEILARHGVQPSQLEVEITETAMLIDPDRSAAILQRIAALGVSLAVDDFGTGYSSFTIVRRLSGAAALKVDRSFVCRMLDNPADAAIVASMVNLVKGLGARSIAEGVEESKTLDLLGKLGCDEVQGYLVSRPVPAEQVPDWLRGHAAAGVRKAG